ncbi:NACHT and WD repeat domain-containing protein 2 isoform X2 [Patella vulgata]|uniref:NACHT and WD repeat domain-containing protein 2 isoform X2 n=1 Tax=Patella vulgata TaxID=6465 RepID=UPI0021809603|nr:NACHT and WD repeat domain-containing protein 2 isoform X2 [Patella vulgata]
MGCGSSKSFDVITNTQLEVRPSTEYRARYIPISKTPTTVQSAPSQNENPTERQDDLPLVGTGGSSDAEIKDKILHGNINVKCPPVAKIVRIFTSSTFTDTEHERNAWMEISYPKLQLFCKERGYDFQVVDMRWGIREEMQILHKTTEICLNEIKLCNEISTGPSFVTLYAQRYGWCPYPTEISETDYNILTDGLQYKEKELIDKWYKYDENRIPAEYVILPVTKIYPDYTKNEKQEQGQNSFGTDSAEFTKIIARQAVSKMSREGQRKYITSVTEKEIEAGILNRDQEEVKKTCLWFYRTIRDIHEQDPKTTPKYSDISADNDVSKQLFEELKEKKMKDKLPEQNIINFDVSWTEAANDSTEHKTYISKFCESCVTKLSDMINSGIKEREERELDFLLKDISRHIIHCQNLCRNFSDRKEHYLKIIRDHIQKDNKLPLLIHGETGCGKSSLVAKVVQQCWELDTPSAVIIRFGGLTPESMTVKSTLISIYLQISRVINDDTVIEPDMLKETDYSAICHGLNDMLARTLKEIVIIIDSLDRLSPPEEASNRAWIPDQLSKCVTVIITADSPVGFDKADKLEINKFTQEEAENVLLHLLKQENRRLTDIQKKIVGQVLEKFHSPLMVRLLYDVVVKWTSYDLNDVNQVNEENKTNTADPSASIITQLVSHGDEGSAIGFRIRAIFESLEKIHGIELVKKTLGYLTIAKRGFTEKELIDLLSFHNDVVKQVENGYWVIPDKRIPISILLRLLRDLDVAIERRDFDDLSVVVLGQTEFRQQVSEVYLLQKKESCPDTDKSEHRPLRNILLDKLKTYFDDSKKFTNDSIRKLNNLPWIMTGYNPDDLKTRCLCNLEFLVAKIKHIGVESVISDIAEAVNVYGENKMADCMMIKVVLQISQNALSRDPHQLPVQVLGRITSSKKSKELETLLHKCEDAGFTTISTKSKILSSVGQGLTCCLPVHGGCDIIDLHVTRDGTTAITCGTNERKCLLQFWDVHEVRPINTLTLTGPRVSKTLLTMDDRFILVMTEDALTAYDTQKRILLSTYTFKDHRPPIDSNTELPIICLGGHAKQVAGKDAKQYVGLFWNDYWKLLKVKDGSLKDYEQQKMDPLQNYKTGKESLTSGCKNYMAWTDETRRVLRVFDIGKQTAERSDEPYSEESHKIDAMCFTGDGSGIVISSKCDKYILILSSTDLKQLHFIKGYDEDSPQDFRFFSDKYLYFPSKRRVVLVDVQTQQRAWLDIHPCHLKVAGITVLQSSLSSENDGGGTSSSRVLTVGDDGNLRIWKYENLSKLLKESDDIQNTDVGDKLPIIRSVKCVPGNGRYCVLHSAEIKEKDYVHYISVWDVIENKMVRKSQLKGWRTTDTDIEVIPTSESNPDPSIIIQPKRQRNETKKIYRLDLNTMEIKEDDYKVDNDDNDDETKDVDLSSFSFIQSNMSIVGIHGDENSLITISIEDKKSERYVDRCSGYWVNKQETILVAETSSKSMIEVFEIKEGKIDKVSTKLKKCDMCSEMQETKLKGGDFDLLSISEDGQFIIFLVKVLKIIVYDRLNDKTVSPELCRHGNEWIDHAVFITEEKILCSFNNGTFMVVSHLNDGKTYEVRDAHNAPIIIDGNLSSPYYTTYGIAEKDQTLYIRDKHSNNLVASFTSDMKLHHPQLGSDGCSVIAGVQIPCCVTSLRIKPGKLQTSSSSLSSSSTPVDTNTDIWFHVDDEYSKEIPNPESDED